MLSLPHCCEFIALSEEEEEDEVEEKYGRLMTVLDFITIIALDN